MRTYYQMIRSLRGYNPAKRGFTSEEEFKMIDNHFGLSKMSLLELMNLRDMVVLVYGGWLDDATDDFQAQRKLMDAMQSIICVIDSFKYKAGAEV